MGIFDKAKDALNSDKGEEFSDKGLDKAADAAKGKLCLLYTSPSPRDRTRSRMPSSA